MIIAEIKFLLLLILILLLGIHSQVQAYGLEDYLSDVQAKNHAIQGSTKAIKGTTLRTNEAKLYYAPSFFFNGQYSDDKRPTNAPSFQGTQTLRKTYQAGLAQTIRTGTKASVSYNFTQTTINGAAPGVLPQTNFYDLAPQFELSQSLWRNFLGTESTAQEKIIKSQAELANFSEKYKYKQLIMNAEINYWRMVFAKQNVQVQKESLDRAKKLRDWNAVRVRDGLTDQSDLMQADAALKARELEYQNALIEEKSVARLFNSLREVDSEEVSDVLASAKDETFLSLTLPQRVGNREDVEVSRAQKELAVAQAELGSEKNKPTLELYGSYSLNGRAANSNDAFDRSRDSDHPFTIVGVRFNTPLNIGNMMDNKDGYAQEKMAAGLNFERKLYEQEKEWQDLSLKFRDFQERLRLSQAIENAQKDKLNGEKNRLNRGRTTTFQVLQFEQDYANAQLLKLRNQADLINLHAQLKLFSGATYEK